MRAGSLRLAGVAFALGLLALQLRGEAGPLVQVDFSNPGLTPSTWTLTLHPDGTGHFHSERGTANLEGTGGIDAPDVDRDIKVSVTFAGRVFAVARRRKWFNAECESHLKVAFQGWKTLNYAGPEGQGSCKFNYSKDKEIQDLGDSIVAVAGSILEGARLETLQQHDRLGLDREMQYVVDAVKDGRVQEICVIRGTLERLSEDQAVLERVRKRARMLLDKVED